MKRGIPMIKHRPLPRLRVQIPFERSFTQQEFLRVSQGLLAERMDDRWNIFFKDPWLTVVRLWTGFCIYKVRIEKRGLEYKVTRVLINRDRRQYGGDDPREETELLSFLIDGMLLRDRDCRRTRQRFTIY
jgi:hypothetical protein